MAKLYKLLHGRSKDVTRMKKVMVDTLRKCENYRDAREKNVCGHHAIVEAEPGETQWRQKRPKGGYIAQGGYNEHT